MSLSAIIYYPTPSVIKELVHRVSEIQSTAKLTVCDSLDHMHSQASTVQESLDCLFIDANLDDDVVSHLIHQLTDHHPRASIIAIHQMVAENQPCARVRAGYHLHYPFQQVEVAQLIERLMKLHYPERRRQLMIQSTSTSSLAPIYIRDITYLERQLQGTRIHLVNEQEVSTTHTLEELKRLLRNESFVPCHADYVVNLFHVSSVHETKVVLVHRVLPIAALFYDKFISTYHEHQMRLQQRM